MQEASTAWPTRSSATARSWTTEATGGGGAVFLNSDGQFINCTFAGNSAVQGGGVYVRNQSPTLDQCTIESNTAQYGGGVYLFVGTSPIFLDCVIRDNIGTSYAGAVSAYQSGSAVFQNCIISHNSTPGNGGAFWFLLSQTNMAINNCRDHIQ